MVNIIQHNRMLCGGYRFNLKTLSVSAGLYFMCSRLFYISCGTLNGTNSRTHINSERVAYFFLSTCFFFSPRFIENMDENK